MDYLTLQYWIIDRAVGTVMTVKKATGKDVTEEEEIEIMIEETTKSSKFNSTSYLL